MKKISPTQILYFKSSLLLLNANLTLQQNCDVFYLKATCINQVLPDVPQNLPTNIEVLDLSHSHLEKITSTSFKLYPNLRILIMEIVSINHTDSVLFLKPLKSLEMVSFSFSFIDGLPFISYPSSIRSLNLSNLGIEKFEGKNQLPNLEVLILDRNKMKKFPKICHNAPLKQVNLDFNSEIMIFVEDLIPFCHLTDLSANMYSTKAITREEYCECLRLKKWLQDHSILANTGDCQFSKTVKCDLDFDDEIMNKYYECMKDIPSRSFSIIYMTFILILLLIALIILIAKYILKNSPTEINRKDGEKKGENDAISKK